VRKKSASSQNTQNTSEQATSPPPQRIKRSRSPSNQNVRRSASPTQTSAGYNNLVASNGLAEEITEYLSKIEATQRQQQESINKLNEKIDRQLPLIASVLSNPELEFERSFLYFMQNYYTIKPEERHEKLRKIVKTGSPKENEKFAELLELFWNEGICKEQKTLTGSITALPNSVVESFQQNGKLDE